MAEILSQDIGDGRVLHYFWFEAMHSRMDVAFCADVGDLGIVSVADAVEAKVDRLGGIFNRFDPSSELSLLNTSGGGQAGEDLYRILDLSKEWHLKTLGYFDISLGTGMEHVGLDEARKTVDYHGMPLSLDLGGCAKGYALDQVIDILKAWGIRDALVNFGNSTVSALGNHPCGQGWEVGFDLLLPGLEESGLDLEPGTYLSVSGNDTDERKHIVNPHTGEMKEGQGIAYVLASSGFAAEALSTAMYAAPAHIWEHMKSLPELFLARHA